MFPYQLVINNWSKSHRLLDYICAQNYHEVLLIIDQTIIACLTIYVLKWAYTNVLKSAEGAGARCFRPPEQPPGRCDLIRREPFSAKQRRLLMLGAQGERSSHFLFFCNGYYTKILRTAETLPSRTQPGPLPGRFPVVGSTGKLNDHLFQPSSVFSRLANIFSLLVDIPGGRSALFA